MCEITGRARILSSVLIRVDADIPVSPKVAWVLSTITTGPTTLSRWIKTSIMSCPETILVPVKVSALQGRQTSIMSEKAMVQLLSAKNNA